MESGVVCKVTDVAIQVHIKDIIDENMEKQGSMYRSLEVATFDYTIIASTRSNFDSLNTVA